MQASAGGIGRAAKVWLLAGVVVIAATLALAQDSRPAVGGPGTAIIVSTSNTLPIPIYSIPILVDGSPVELYIWAKDVVDPMGVSAFQIAFEYDSSLIAVTSLFEDTIWLESTLRSSGVCMPQSQANRIQEDPATGEGYAKVGCDTVWEPPPLGPQGSGLLGSLTVAPRLGAAPGRTTLDFAIPHANPFITYETFLLAPQYITGGDQPPDEISATVPTINVAILKCGDVTDDGVVSISDIFGVAGRFPMVPSNPDWDPIFDLDADGAVSISDIFGVAMQFATFCSQPPP